MPLCGRLSELVGSATLPLDKQMRVFGLAHLAEGDLAAQAPEARALLEAYAAGVNAWIASRGRFAALEFLFLGPPEPWRATDSLLWGRTMSLWLSSNYRTELCCVRRCGMQGSDPGTRAVVAAASAAAPTAGEFGGSASGRGGAGFVPHAFAARGSGDGERSDAVGRGARDVGLRALPARTRDPRSDNPGSADGPVKPGHDGGEGRPVTRGGTGHVGGGTVLDEGGRSLTGEGRAMTGEGRPMTREGRAMTGLRGGRTWLRCLPRCPHFPPHFTLPSHCLRRMGGGRKVPPIPARQCAWPGDPHLSFDFPSLWYLVRIETPGHLLVGATGPGAPFLVLGHNGQIAWTFTTTGADTQDVWLEPADAAFTAHQERIKVRGQPDTLLTVRETRHGPVISDLLPANGPIMAVAMANLLPRDTGATGLVALNHARTVEEAGKAAPLIASPVQNLMVADRTKIGLFVTGRIPIRRAGDGWAPEAPTTARNAADDIFDWAGLASGDALPHVVAPSSGRLVNARNDYRSGLRIFRCSWATTRSPTGARAGSGRYWTVRPNTRPATSRRCRST